MNVFEIHGKYQVSKILIGESFQNLDKYIDPSKTTIITDKNVKSFYQKDFPKCRVIEIGTGEKIKTLDTVHNLYEKLLEFKVDRSSFILGIGGGIVCDITGFVASTFMRGLSFSFVATTLLSQVDASIGGKNGVNFKGYKNIIGVFRQPNFILCDFEMLKTLPEKELLSGFAEILKHAVIGDKILFLDLEQNSQKIFHLDRNYLEKIVFNSIAIKSVIVEKDETEENERRKLNFGHTFGHAIEKTSGVSHGEAVSIGMSAALRLSVIKGMLFKTESERIITLLKKMKLPTRMDSINKEEIIDALSKDKKRKGENVRFVLLNEIGNAVSEEISLNELGEIVHDLC